MLYHLTLPSYRLPFILNDQHIFSSNHPTVYCTHRNYYVFIVERTFIHVSDVINERKQYSRTRKPLSSPLNALISRHPGRTRNFRILNRRGNYVVRSIQFN